MLRIQTPRPLVLALVAAAVLSAPVLAADATRTEGTFDSNGVAIHYIEQGKGDPLILVHGFSASADTNWVQPGLFDKLATEFHVIALDNRGHGQSGKPHDPAQYGDEMARDVLRLMDHVGIRQAHIAGYSMGGFITMRLLAIAPERFLTAVVGGAGWRPEGADAVTTQLAESLEKGEGIRPLLVALNPADAPPLPEEQVSMMNNMVMASNDPLALAASIRGMAQLGVTEAQLRANKVATLAVVGSRDPLKAGVDAMNGVMSNLEVRVIEGADHVSALMNPQFSQQLYDAIHEFLIAACHCA